MYTVVNVKDSYTDELGTEIVGASYFISDATPDEESEEMKTWPTSCGIGSRFLVISTGHIYMFGPSKKWVLYKGVSIMN